MAHYAFINEENIVVEVITGKDEDDLDTLPEGYESWEEYYESKRDGLICKRTSYNTMANQHLNEGTPFRGNYAGIGMTYDIVNDVFYGEQPFPSWLLNETTWTWEAPVPYPSDANNKMDTSLPYKSYVWSEDDTDWILDATYNYNAETEEWELAE